MKFCKDSLRHNVVYDPTPLLHYEALPPENSSGEPSFAFLTAMFLVEKSHSLWSHSVGSWCVVQVTINSVNVMEWKQ